MDVECQNSGCDHRLKGPKRLLGHRVRCDTCGHEFIWAERYYNGVNFVVYDLETTGLSPDDDEIIQIAAVRYFGGRPDTQDSFFSYARPRQQISGFIESYTGISDEHVRDAPRPEDVLCRFSSWAGDDTLIAHNGKRFDGKFLEAISERHPLPSREILCIDSIQISKMLFGRTRGIRHSLDLVKSRLAIAETSLRRHDARGDVDILGRAVAEMQSRLRLDNSLNGVPRHTTRLPGTGNSGIVSGF
jgi:DNA polymerase III subunit epsilon